jgi:hypothetical protein
MRKSLITRILITVFTLSLMSGLAFAHEPARRPQSVEILLSELQAALS